MTNKHLVVVSLLTAIRDSHEQLHETEGGCALWVQSLLNNAKKP